MSEHLDGSSDAIALACQVVRAYVTNNHIAKDDLPAVIKSVHAAFVALQKGEVSGPVPDKPTPRTASEIRKSVTKDYLVSFEDGKSYKTLRRHLNMHGLTPETYREKWGLPNDYPMTSPSYSERRSELAKKAGLGGSSRS